MEEEKLKKLLGELSEQAAEPARPGLVEDIKQQIPQLQPTHRRGMDTINIVIDLRISKLAAAAVIIVTIILCANLFGLRDSTGGEIIDAIHYSLAGEKVGRSKILDDMSRLYEDLLEQGKEVVYYGDSVNFYDNNAVLMYWKLPDDRYSVIFCDLRIMTVSADVLILLQTQMLQNNAK